MTILRATLSFLLHEDVFDIIVVLASLCGIGWALSAMYGWPEAVLAVSSLMLLGVIATRLRKAGR